MSAPWVMKPLLDASSRKRARITAVVYLLCLYPALAHPAVAQPALPRAAPIALQFAGLTLSAALQRAVAASPEVHAAQAAVAGARAAFDQARGSFGLAATGGYTEAPQGAPGGTIAQRLSTVGAQLTLGDLFSFSPLLAQAAASMHSAEADESTAERSESVRVVELYFGALKARAVVSARADARASADAFNAAARKRFAAGEAPRIDIIRAQVAKARAEADLARARADDANATDALARETGLGVEGLVDARNAAPAPAVILSPEAAVARALAARNDLRSADNSVRGAEAAVRAAQRGAIPPITLGAGYQRGVDSGFPVQGPVLNAQIAIPLGTSAGARVRVQRALLDAANARRAGIERTITVEVAAAARTASATVEAERATAAARDAARAELDATTLGYASGASSSLDLSSARSAYAQAQVDELSALYDRLQAQATLDLEVSQ